MIKSIVSFAGVKKYSWIYFCLLILALDFITANLGYDNYALFHTVVEIFNVFMGFLIFVITINAAKLEHFQGVFKVLGVGYLFVSIVNTFHAYAYLSAQTPGLESLNLAIQFRTLERLMEAFTMLLAAIVVKREIHFQRLMTAYFIVTNLLLASILYWHIFPDCYTLEGGATNFKVLSSCFITMMMIIGIIILATRRQALDIVLFRYLFTAFSFAAASEMLLSYEVQNPGGFSVAAHLVKLLTYYFVYKAVVEVSMLRPYKALQESQKRYSSMFEFSVIGMAIISMEGKVQRANSAICKIIGYTKEELMELGFSKITHPDDQEREHFYQNKLRTGELPYYQMEKRYIHKQGHNVWVNISLSTVTDEQGLPLYFAGQTEDITKRKKAEEELKKSEERFRLLIESIPHPVMVLDRNWRFVLSNNLKEPKIRNISQEKLIGMKIYEIWPNAEKSKVFQAFVRVMETREMENVVGVFEYSDGSSIWHDFTVFPVPEGIMVLAQDIDQKVKGENLLRISRERYQTLLENMPNGIAMADETGIINYVNPAGLAIVRAADENLVLGKSVFAFIPHEFHEDVWKLVDLLVSSNERIGPAEQRIMTLDGVQREVEFSAIPFKNRDELGTLIVFRDVTDIKRAELLEKEVVSKTSQLNEAVEIDRLRSEFFANLSHELRTPLNIILSSTQLLRSFLSDEEPTPHIEKILKSEGYIRQNCYRLLRLINNLIDSTKIDANFYELRLVNCNVVEIVENITLSVADFIDNKELVLCFDTDVEERIIALDPNAIERIMLNLLANAVKFTDRGGSVFVEIVNDQDFVTIFVKDTGMGIPKESLGSIFERFTQAESTLAKKREGSGIGLSLVKSLVELHGGHVAIESVCGEGTTLIVKLPAKTVANDGREEDCDMTKLQTQSINIEFSDVCS